MVDGTLRAGPIRVAGDQKLAAELNRLTARRTPVVADPVAPRPVPVAPAEPPAAPAARTSPVSSVPPVGLAGLAAWWGDDGPEPQVEADPFEPFEPTSAQPRNSAAADSWLSDQRRPEPDGPALLDLGGVVDVDADPLGRFREALEQVLLDEALADGLEVTDGPA